MQIKQFFLRLFPLLFASSQLKSHEGYIREYFPKYTPLLSDISLGMGFQQSQLYPSEGYMREFTVCFLVTGCAVPAVAVGPVQPVLRPAGFL